MKLLASATSFALVIATPFLARAQPFSGAADYIVRPPKPSFNLLGALGISSLGDSPRGTTLGGAALIDLRLSRKWGASIGGSYCVFPDPIRPVFSTIHTIIPEVAAMYGGGGKPYAHAETVFLTFGANVVAPIASPTLAPAYLSPFLGFRGLFTPMPTGRFGVLGFVINLQLGYRIPIGGGVPSLVEGFYIETRSGIGFDLL